MEALPDKIVAPREVGTVAEGRRTVKTPRPQPELDRHRIGHTPDFLAVSMAP